MDTLVYYLPAVACVGGMLLCMFMMGRGRSARERGSESVATPATDEEIARLRDELDALRAELDRREETREPAS